MLARIRKAREEEGFTLIELLVVMIIIGILAAIAIPLFLNQRKNAVDASMKSDLRTVANEMESYYTDQESYPDTIAVANQVATLSTASGTPASTVDVRLSKGNDVALTLNPGDKTVGAGSAFCLVASNAKGTHDWVYVSNLGGLQPAATTACPTAGSGNGW